MHKQQKTTPILERGYSNENIGLQTLVYLQVEEKLARPTELEPVLPP